MSMADDDEMIEPEDEYTEQEPEEGEEPAELDEDLLAPDDVEADLDTILKDRLVAAEEDGGDEEDDEPDDRVEPGDRLQPKRADEQLCPSCFLLVRQSAPGCPVGDDDCPLFS